MNRYGLPWIQVITPKKNKYTKEYHNALRELHGFECAFCIYSIYGGLCKSTSRNYKHTSNYSKAR
ncbi:hypothetical protein MTBBW1_1090002 [Desulfamplus magnetovallimortis]|uniref:Uncharacterized protein n=1 Tax=Desulfamplus magnetovallimortis TaxID=1246637 RepID=A0A1W1H5E5_9BACT|nr:hypothetical protein MTBBW1_1090002 [Desulfamplus magnetovallimortis]